MTNTVNALWRLVQNCTALALSDGDLLRQYSTERAHEAFAELVRRHGPLVLGVCRRLLGDLHAAEDAFQATFLVLARKAGSLRDPDRLAAWLHGVAYRIASKARRHRLRYPESLDREYDPIDSRTHTVDRADDCRPWLDEAIHALPAKYREPVVLCYIEGLTNAEAAGRLGCPLGTVATRLARARERLRLHFARRGCIVPAAMMLAVIAEASAASPLPEKLATTALANLDGPINACVVTLTEGAISAMKIKKLQWVLGALLLFGLGGFGLKSFTAGAYEPPMVTEPPIPPAVHASDALIATPNFVVEGAPSRTARLIAVAAEQHRKSQALYWIGEELPKWPEPCRIKVGINNGGRNAGATTFYFLDNKVQQSMTIDGSLERILSDLLPHEVTHTVLASHFRKAIPRWVDEGIASSAESLEERKNYERKLLEAVANARMIKMSRLFAHMDYPKDIMTFHAQSISIVRFLTKRKNPATLLAFVKDGMDKDWNSAVKKHYGYADVDALEEDWLVGLLKQLPAIAEPLMPPEPPKLIATGPAPATALAEISADGLFVRISQPMVQSETVTSYVQREADGKKYYEPVTDYRQKLRTQISMQRLDQTKAFDIDGKPIETKKLVEICKKGTTVLLSPVGGKIDPFYLSIIKPGTIIIAMNPLPPAISPPPLVEPGPTIPPPITRP